MSPQDSSGGFEVALFVLWGNALSVYLAELEGLVNALADTFPTSKEDNVEISIEY